MIRGALIDHGVGEDGFRWRSTEITRIEALSDAVFAFAVTLLIVALEVPRTFQELWEIMQGFPAFAASFALLFHLWFLQYQFFRRYGLQDALTLCWNGALLFVVLFFVYPLKFLFGFLWRLFTHGEMMVHTHQGTVEPIIQNTDIRPLMIAYGLGFVAIYGVFWMMHQRAWRMREALNLNQYEQRRTRNALQHFGVDICIGLVSVLLAAVLPGKQTGLAGFAYTALWPAHALLGAAQDRRTKREAPLEGAPLPKEIAP